MFASGVGTGAEAEAGPSFDTPMWGSHSCHITEGTVCQLLEAEKPEEPRHLLQEMGRPPGRRRRLPGVPCCLVSSPLRPCEARRARPPVPSQRRECP